MELNLLDSIANDEQVNYVGVWADIQDTAARRFRNDVIAEFNRKYKIKNLTQSIDIEKKIDTATTTAAAAQYRGFIVELNDATDLYVNSNLQTIYIQYLYLYLSAPVNTTVRVFDLDEEVQLSSFAVTGAAGWNTVNVLTNYGKRRLFIAYDSTAITSVTQNISDLENAVNCDSCGSDYYLWYDTFCNNCGFKIQAASAAIADPYTVTEGDNTFGLSGVFSIGCTYENIICNNLRLFENAWMFVLGSTVMDYKLYTTRLNEFTAFDRNKAADLKKLFEAQYRGGMDANDIKYSGELYNAIDGINLNLNDCCLECNQSIRAVDARL